MEVKGQSEQGLTESPCIDRAERIRRFILDRENYFGVFGAVCKGFVRCGRPNCRCARGGEKHGPYYYLYWRDWREGRRPRRIYLGGPEAGEAARQTLLEIRRKRWRGHDHFWLYRARIKSGLAWVEALDTCLDSPTERRVERVMKRKEKWEKLEPKGDMSNEL